MYCDSKERKMVKIISSERNEKDGIFSLSQAWDKENVRVPDGNRTHGLTVCRTRVTTNSVNKTSLVTSLLVAQWSERPTGVREVVGSIPVGDSGVFVPLS